LKRVFFIARLALLGLSLGGVALAPGASWAQLLPGTEAAPSPSGPKIVDLRVEGNRRVEVEAIRRALKNRPGETFDPTKTAEDLRSVWGLGYFEDVQLLVQRTNAGIVYVVRVQERPAIRQVKLSGNEELSYDDLKDAIDLKPYSILDLDAVRRNAKKIADKYTDKGYFLAEVTYRLERVPDTAEVDVVLVISEHAKVMVKEVRFIGASRVPPSELKSVMATKEGGFLSFITGEGTYREELFQRDQAAIQAAYYDRGFVNVKLDKPVTAISADKRNIYITLKVEEGEQFDIGKLDVSGDMLFDKEKILSLMESHEGETFNRARLGQDIQKITELYADEGYAYANVSPLTQLHPEERKIDLTFDIQKGKQVSIERIDIHGNSKTRDQVIRREMRVYEGELFNGSGLRKSRERVTALGFFETVEVTHKPGSADDKVIVQVEVKEKSTGTFQVGFGFSNIENFIFTAQISQNNFLGWGQTVSASAQVSSLRNLAQISFFDPYLFDTNYIFSADAYIMHSERFDYIRFSRGGNISLGYHLLEDVMATVTYTLERVNVEPGRTFDQLLLANQFRKGYTSSLRLSLTWDRRDNRLFPSKGFMHFASVEVAPEFLGGSFNFARYTAYSRFYWPLFWGMVFKTNITGGYIQQLDSSNPLPISELYYLGGINTVRGYYLTSISPRVLAFRSDRPDSAPAPFFVGGNKQIYANFELEFPIVDKVGIRGVVFYDAGNVYGANERFFESKQYSLPLGLFHAVGFGFRWFSPLGPLRFEWGIPLNRRPDVDQALDFQFTIGNFF
jgi:outer membrane protein insertion porin family